MPKTLSLKKIVSPGHLWGSWAQCQAKKMPEVGAGIESKQAAVFAVLERGHQPCC